MVGETPGEEKRMPESNRTDRQEEENRRREAAQEREESRQEAQEDHDTSGSASAQESPSQADSSGNASPRPSAAGRRHHRRDSQTKNLYRKLHTDRKTIDETIERLTGCAEEAKQVDSDEKREDMMERLQEEKLTAEEILDRATNEYEAEAESLSSDHYKRAAAQKVQALSEKAEEATDLYDQRVADLDAAESEYKLKDFEGRLRELRVERYHKKRDNKMVHFREFRSMKYRFGDLMAEYRTLPSPKSPAAEERKKKIDERIQRHTEKLEELESKYMPEWEKHVLKDKEKKSQDAVNELNSQYSSSTPLVRLLYKVLAIKDKRKPKETGWQKLKGKVSDVKEEYDSVSEIKDDASDVWDSIGKMREGTFFQPDEEEEEEEGIKEWLTKHAKEFLGWIMGKAGASEKQQKIGKDVIEHIANWFEPVISAVKLAKNIKSFMSKSKDMSKEEVSGFAMEVTGQSIEVIESGLGSVQKYIGEIPILGSIFGIVKDIVGLIDHIIKFANKIKFRKDTKKDKEDLKNRMMEKRQKYSMQEDTRDLGLYSFMGMARVGPFWDRRTTAHVKKSEGSAKRGKEILVNGDATVGQQKTALTRAVGAGESDNLYMQIAEMKAQKDRGELSLQERQKYYQMKTLRDIQEYQQLKEGKHTISKRIREESFELASGAVSLASNISGLFPGIGTAVSKGLSFANTVFGLIRKGTSFVHKRMQARSGAALRKQARNDAMAQNMFNQMLYVAGYLRPDMEDNTAPLFHVGPESAKRVKTSMQYLDRTSTALSYKLSEMQEAEDRDSLMEMMANAFTTSG